MAGVTRGPCSALGHRRSQPLQGGGLAGQDGSFQKDDAQRLPRHVPSLGRAPLSPGTLALSPAAISDTVEGTVWLVTGDPQHPATLSRATQKQSEKINEVFCCSLTDARSPSQAPNGPGLPRARAPQPVPSRMQIPRESRAAVPAPRCRAGPRPQPPAQQKIIIPRNCRAGENKSRKDVKGGEDARCPAHGDSACQAELPHRTGQIPPLPGHPTTEQGDGESFSLIISHQRFTFKLFAAKELGAQPWLPMP